MRADFARLAAILVSLVAGHAAVADWRVWTVTETRHVLRSEPPGSDLAVKVAAARNERVSFQILVRSDEPVKAVAVEAAELRGPGAAVLPASQSRLYRQHQLYLDVGTYRNEAFQPDWYPDPLIPCGTAGGASPMRRAVPFDLPAGETHGFWVDLYVPAQTPPGDYHGVYRVTAEGGKSLEVPVTLTVWSFTLPPTPTLVTAFGSPAQRMRDHYRQRAKEGKDAEPSDWPAVEAQCAQLLSEHCLNATPAGEMLRPVAQSDGSFRIPAEQVRAIREFVDRYHVNALEIPHPSSVIQDPVGQRDNLRAWLAAFDRAAKELDRPHIVFYVYLKDEPNTREDYEYLAMLGHSGKSAEADGVVLRLTESWFRWDKDLAAMIVQAAEPRSSKPAQAVGPLRAHPTNPRYFTDATRNADGSLKAVYVTGSHTWNNLLDMDKEWKWWVVKTVKDHEQTKGKQHPVGIAGHGELASTEFCLADPDTEYLVYVPDSGEVTVDLSAAPVTLTVEWLNPHSCDTVQGQSTSGGDAVLYLRRQT